MTNKQYDTLKTIALIITPVLAFLASCVTIWGIPYGEQIVGTITAVVTFLGVCLGISNKNYKEDGITEVFNEDLLKDMLGYEEMLHEDGELESEV